MKHSREELAKMTSDFLKENSLNHARRRQGPIEHGGRHGRDVIAKKYRQDSVRTFVEANRHEKGVDCVFVPGATKDIPAAVVFCDRNISAARYMCLLTHGTPKSEGMVARHTCGNGHLSCVNPNHVVWGTPGDNRSDANRHRAVGSDIQDRIHSIS